MTNYASDTDTEASRVLANTDSERSDENHELSEDDDEDEEDEDSDEYVDKKVNEQFERQYQQAQTQTFVSRSAPSAKVAVAGFHGFGERPIRRTTKVAVNYSEKQVKHISYRSNQSTSTKVELSKPMLSGRNTHN
jgi:hypothetical protein